MNTNNKLGFETLGTLLILVLCFSFTTLTAQNEDEGGSKYSNEFLSIGVGARAQGLGNAVIANVDDVYGGYWNPAGLVSPTTSEHLQLGAMHSEWFAGVGKFDYLGVAMPLVNNKRRIGVSMVRFGVDQIPNTLSLYDEDGTINYDNVTEFSAADYGFLFSYAQKLKAKDGNHFAVGGNLKIVRRLIGSFAHSWGFGVDLGAQFHTSKGLRLGLVLRDVTTTFNGWSFNFTEQEKDILAITGNAIPINSVEYTLPQILIGLGYHLEFGKIGLTPELDLVATTDGQRNTLISAEPLSIDPSFGLEVDYNNIIYLRAGVRQFQRLKDLEDKEFLTATPGFGVGLKLKAFRLDYAYTTLGAVDNAYSHIISLVLELKKRGRR